MAAQTTSRTSSSTRRNLYREEIFTDRRAGTIRRLTPVKPDGATDTTRHVLFSGQTQLMTPAGVLPLVFEIEAASLDEAMQKFPDGVKAALEQAIDEARECGARAPRASSCPRSAAAAPARAARRRQDQVLLIYGLKVAWRRFQRARLHVLTSRRQKAWFLPAIP